MVNSEWTFTVTHYDKDDSWDDTDISDDAFPRMFTDTGGGKVNAAKIRIIAQGGQYIQGDPEVNSKPQIKHNDRIRIVAIDGTTNPDNTYNKVFEVIKLTPIKSKGEGVMLDVELLGLERWLQKMNYSNRVVMRFPTPKELFADLVAVYNNQAGTWAVDTPTINLTGGGDITVNELPDTADVTGLDWGNNEDTIFNRMTELLDAMAAPQASGGVLDFFDMRITYPTDNVTSFNISVFSSGYANDSKPSITLNSTDINTEDTAGGFEEPQGLLINSWGASGAGSLPTNWSKWQSKVLVMPTNKGSQSNFPEWQSDFPYSSDLGGAHVKYTSGVDKCYRRIDTTVAPPYPATPPNLDSDWEEIDIDDYYTYSRPVNDGVIYSPWTNSDVANGVLGVDAWTASLANPTGVRNDATGVYGKCAWDANIIINDSGGLPGTGGAWRSWVDVVALSPSVVTSSKSAWLYEGDTLYDGFRVLVKGTGSGGWSDFSNHIIQYDGDEGIWKSVYELAADNMIAIFEEGVVYRYNGSGSYTDFRTEHNGNDCFHPLDRISSSTDANSLSQVESFSQNKSDLSSIVNYSKNGTSAIAASYKWTPLQSWWEEWDDLLRLASPVGNLAYLLYQWQNNSTVRNTAEWYSVGVWLNIRFPFPKNSLPGGIAANELGYFYGGQPSDDGTTSIVPQLDTQNMTYSSDGKKGFNQGGASEDLGPISSIDFVMKIRFQADWNSPIQNPSGYDQLLVKEKFQMRCFVIDQLDNVAFQDFEIPFNDLWESVSLPLSGFNTYRGRRPIYKTGFWTSLVIPPKEVKEVTQIRWDKIAMLCIQCSDSYDEPGRYRAASGNDFGFGSPLWNSVTMTYFKTTIFLDGLRFTKPLLCNSGQIKTSTFPAGNRLNNEPDFVQAPGIIRYEALKNNTLSELKKHEFKNKRYDITTQGQFDIQFGDYFVLEDEDIVDETYLSVENRILLVAKHIEYEFSKPDTGAGGFERRIMGAKRFV